MNSFFGVTSVPCHNAGPVVEVCDHIWVSNPVAYLMVMVGEIIK
jgi:hypothetical protein